MIEEDRLRAYAMLKLRLDRRLAEHGDGLSLEDYLGPRAWREEAAAEEPPSAGRLVEDPERLLAHLPFEPPRYGFLAKHAAAWHRGGTRSTILINGDRPFNLADLLYVVAHEGTSRPHRRAGAQGDPPGAGAWPPRAVGALPTLPAVRAQRGARPARPGPDLPRA